MHSRNRLAKKSQFLPIPIRSGIILVLLAALALNAILPWTALADAVITVDTANDVVDGTTTSIAALIANPGADGKISLREAISAANNTAGADTILFDSSIDGTPIVLDIAGTNEDANVDGDLDIDGDGLTITGNGESNTIIDGNDDERMLHVWGGDLTVQNITLTGGNETSGKGGGAIYITTTLTLTLTSSSLISNTSNGNGGALHITMKLGNDETASAYIYDTVFDDNDCSASKGGAINFDMDGDNPSTGASVMIVMDTVTMTNNVANSGGGAINADSDSSGDSGTITMSLRNMLLSNNRSNTYSGGAIYFDNDADGPNATIDTHLENLELTNNYADYAGGAINFDNDANNPNATINTVLNNLLVDDNEANTYRGGGINFDNDSNAPNATITILIDNSTITNNESATYLGGGIAFGDDASDPGAVVTTTIQNSTIANNQTLTSDGGGIFVDGAASDVGASYTLFIINTAITGNTAQAGGGIMLSSYANYADGGVVDVIVDRSLIANNKADVGGGIYQEEDGGLTVVNSTLSGNRALAGSGGGYYQSSGQDDPPIETSFINSTLARNEASVSGGGISLGVTETVTISNSIVANNTAPVDVDLDTGTDSSFSINSSLIGDVGGSSYVDNGGNQLGGSGNPVIDPLLDPLANNGGDTQTHALQAGSTAIDAGDNTICAASPVNGVDQRGVFRPHGENCDIGAYEFVIPVGGSTILPNKLLLLAPWIGLAALVLFATLTAASAKSRRA